ncbi:unnamed protein product [Mycena citricolor]|uniref:Phosphatidylglycerol/phosphatidylinositol transfer protein n=1 Tax=Mycena citricolor TaxID=2018698 RepID=A0AAD2HVI3_9AGAR|nr:unnamed protein product [Mycena citricolor]CAK5282926.1 unnamed protein product [Mycena citricolor]
MQLPLVTYLSALWLLPIAVSATPRMGTTQIVLDDVVALPGDDSSTMKTMPETTGLRTTAAWGWEDCGSPSDGIIVKSLTVSPDPPVPGQDLVVKATGVANYDIEDGAWADVVVKLGLVKLLHRRFDVCEEARNANASIQCPIKEGTHEVTQVVALPKEIPRAKFTVDVNGYTADDDDLLCVKLKVDFLPNRRWFGLL